MSVLAAVANGNLTSAATWELVDATSYLNSETGSEVLTTAYSGTRSSAFTPGAITIDGLGVKLSVRTGTTGTISVELAQAGTPVSGTEVTINTADLPAAVTANSDGGWVFFKFAAPVLLVTATAYTIEAKTSTASMVSLFRDGTTDNIARYLRTTTTQAPIAGDDLIIAGEYTAAGAMTARTVTMDSTATTDYGSNTNSLITPALAIVSGGTLRYGATAATAYYLKLSGNAIVYLGGQLDIGTTGTPMPANSSAVLEFDPAADGDMGLTVRGGTCIAQGNPVTPSAMLAADASAAATALTTNISTDWKNGDLIALAPTTRTASEAEAKALTADAVTTALTITALTSAHSGTGELAAELINLTRNVKIRSASSTVMAYVVLGNAALTAPTVDWDYVEVYYVGENAALKRGIETSTAGSSVNLNGCSIHDTEDGGLYVAAGTPTITNGVGYNLNTAAATIGAVNLQSGATLTAFKLITFGNSLGILIGSAAAVLSNCVAAGGTGTAAHGFNITFLVTQTGSVTDCVAHSNLGFGFLCGNSGARYTMTTCTAWRNNCNGGIGSGFELNTGNEGIFISCVSFGNNGSGIGANSVPPNGIVELRSCVFNGGTTLVQAIGMKFTPINVSFFKVYLYDCSFGVTTDHTTADVTDSGIEITLFNCILDSATEVVNPTADNGSIRSHRHDQSATTYKTWHRYGRIEADQTTRHTASGFSWKLTPNIATRKLILRGPSRFDTFKTAVNGTGAITLTAWVQKDGSYNGNAPRLVLLGGIVPGIGSVGTDVIDSLTVGASTWEQLSVTATPTEAGVIEYYLDCDGTAGNVYVDDIGIVQA